MTAFTGNALLARYKELPGCFPKWLCASVSLPQRGRVPGAARPASTWYCPRLFVCFSLFLRHPNSGISLWF